MFLSRNKKNNVYPCKPQFYYIKVGFKGPKLYRYVFVMYQEFTICSIQELCKRVANSSIRLCESAGGSGLSFSTYAPKVHFPMAGSNTTGLSPICVCIYSRLS